MDPDHHYRVIQLHQQQIARGTGVVKRHREAQTRLLAAAARPPPTAMQSASAATTCLVELHSEKFARRDFAAVCTILFDEGEFPADTTLKNAVFVLYRLCDEIYALVRRDEDHLFPKVCVRGDDLIALDELSRTAVRLTDLMIAVISNMEAIQRLKVVFPRGLEEASPLYHAVADVMCHLATIDVMVRGLPHLGGSEDPASRNGNNNTSFIGRALFRLRETHTTCLSSTMPEKMGGIFEPSLRVLKSWLEAASSPEDGFRCLSLFLVLFATPGNRSRSEATKTLSKIWALQQKVAPIIPVCGVRFWVTIEEVLARHYQEAVFPPDAGSTWRRAHLEQLMMSVNDISRRIAREVAAEPTLELATRAKRVVTSILALAACERSTFGKTVVRPLIVLMECLKVVEVALLRKLAAQVVVPASGLGVGGEGESSSSSSGGPKLLLDMRRRLRANRGIVTPSRAVADWILSCAVGAGGVGEVPPAFGFIHVATACPTLFERHVRLTCETQTLLFDYPNLLRPMISTLAGGSLDFFAGGEDETSDGTVDPAEADVALVAPSRIRRFVGEVCFNGRAYRDDDEMNDAFDRSVCDALHELVTMRIVVPWMTRRATDEEADRQGEERLLPLRHAFILESYLALPRFRFKHFTYSIREAACEESARTRAGDGPLSAGSKSAVAMSAFLLSLVATQAGIREFERFSYEAVGERFIERRPSAPSPLGPRHRSFGVSEVVYAIRFGSLGRGQVSTSIVNASYRHLVKRFEIISQYMFDGHVKAYCKRERRSWQTRHSTSTSTSSSAASRSLPAQQQHHLDVRYPYEKARHFVRDAKPSSGSSYLSRLRSAITDFGNLLGFVRVVHSACLMTAAASGSGVEASLVPDYVRTLAGVFRRAVAANAERENEAALDHLKSFYILVPALSVNFVEHMAMGKTQVARAAHQSQLNRASGADMGGGGGPTTTTGAAAGGAARDAFYADDGFAMGVAALLSILGQESAFDSLNWFRSVGEFFSSSSSSSAAQGATNSPPNHDGSTVAAGSSSIASVREYELFMYVLGASRCLF